ncbi:unnamed protein product [Jaminaea pallidilutea]
MLMLKCTESFERYDDFKRHFVAAINASHTMAPESSRTDGDRVELLDDEGEMVPRFEDALAYIFQKYCVTSSSISASQSEEHTSGSSTSIQQPKLGSRPAQGAVLSDLALDKFAHDTNGSPFSEDTKEELRTFLDCDDEGRLTYPGFLQMYSLQADNDLDETWKDLSTHGFQGNLDLVQSRIEGSDGLGDGSESKETGSKPSQDASASSQPSAAQAEALEQPTSRSPLLIDLHVKHILKLSSNTTSLAYHMTTHLRMNGVYWGLGALDVLGKGHLLPADDLVDFVLKSWDEKTGGFASYPGHDSHILSTCSAIQILAIKDRLSALGHRRDRVITFIASLQNPASGLLFGDGSRLEEDNRFLYCGVNALAHLGALDSLDREAAVQGVLGCVNFDGGFGRIRGAESHAAQAFTSVGTLVILHALDRLGESTLSKLASWLSERQLPNGGLNGRPEKLEDVCYSWWILTALSMIGKLHWIDAKKLSSFILSCQDPDAGGIADRPDNVSDVYHTFFGCAGLSLLGFPGLQAIDPVYAMPVDVVRRLGIARPYQQKGNAH